MNLGNSVENMFAGPINLERKQCENNPNAYYWTNNGKPLKGYSSLENDDEEDSDNENGGNGGKRIRKSRKSRKSRKGKRLTINRKTKKTRRKNSKKK